MKYYYDIHVRVNTILNVKILFAVKYTIHMIIYLHIYLSTCVGHYARRDPYG